MAQHFPKFFRLVGGQWGQQEDERFEGLLRAHVLAGHEVREFHELRYGGVEAEGVEVVGHSGDGSGQRFGGFGIERNILNAWVKLDGFGHVVHNQSPDSGQESRNAFHALHAPGFGGFERAHEHFVEAEAVGAVFLDDDVGIDHVSATFGHLVGAGIHFDGVVRGQHKAIALLNGLLRFELDLGQIHPLAGSHGEVAVLVLNGFIDTDPAAFGILIDRIFSLAQDHALIDQPVERFGGVNQSAIEQDLVPESAVEEVQDGVFSTTDIEVNRHPVLFQLGAERGGVVFRVHISEVIPARASPLGHGVGFPLKFLGIANPFRGF